MSDIAIPYSPAIAEHGRAQPDPVSRAIVTALVAGLAAASMIVATGAITVDYLDFLPFVIVAAALLLLARYAEWRRLHYLTYDAARMSAYATLGLLACGFVANAGLRLGFPLIDADLATIDAAIGLDVAAATRAAAEHTAAIQFLAAVYNASHIAVAALIVGLLFCGQRVIAWEMVATAIITMQAVAILSVFMPAIGAMAHFNLLDLQGNGLPVGAGVYHLAAFEAAYSGSDQVFELADMEGLVTFPSFHTVLALLLTQGLAHTRLRLLGVAATCAVIVSTVPIGGHYVIDLVAGFAIWALTVTVIRRVQ